MVMANVEHRLLPRQIVSARVIFLLRDEKEDESGEVRDVNRKGAFFYTNVAVTKRQKLLVLLLVQSEGSTVPVFCAGEALRIEEGGATGYAYGVAVKFWQVDTPDTFNFGF